MTDYSLYRIFTEKQGKKVHLNALLWVSVHFVHFSKRIYNMLYTHIRTPLLTNFLVFNLLIYTFINYYFKIIVQFVQNDF